MLPSVTLNCQVTKIAPKGCSLMKNKVVRWVGRWVFFGQVMFPHYSDQMPQKSLGSLL